MKTALTAQQLVHFRQQGKIRFENFPLDFASIEKIAEKTLYKRDFWRNHPSIKKSILHTLSPIALELTKKSSLRLACDQWLESPPKSGRLQDMFCFQGMACVFVFYQDISHPEKETLLDVYEPSCLADLIPPNAYLVVFAHENGVLIDNPKDPFSIPTRNLGYVYGDRLKNEFHPLVTFK